MTTSEQELSEKSPSDKGGEDGSGSESGSEAKESNGNLKIAAAAAKVGNSVQQRVEQEGEGLEEVPTATAKEEGRQSSQPSVPPSVDDTGGGFDDTGEDEEDPLAFGCGPSYPRGENVTRTQGNGSQNQVAAEIGSGDQDKVGSHSKPNVECQAEVVRENGSGREGASRNGSQNPDAEGRAEETRSEPCAMAGQSYQQEQDAQLEESSSTMPQPIKRQDNCTQPQTQWPRTNNGEEEEESALADQKEENSLLPGADEPSEAAVDKIEKPTADVVVGGEGKLGQAEKDEEDRVTDSAHHEKEESVCRENKQELSSAECSPPIASHPTETPQGSSPPKETQQSSSEPKDLPHSTSPAKDQQSSSQLKETQQNSSPPKEKAQSIPVVETSSSASSLQKEPEASLPTVVEHSGSSSRDSLSESEGSNTAPTEGKGGVGNQEEGPTPPEVGERVFVETASGLKMGVVKFAGETQFQPGLWIGVALERPVGEWSDAVFHDMCM